MEYFIALMTDNSSPFNGATTCFTFNNPGALFGEILNMILYKICKGLALVLTALETFANQCYNFLSFSNNDNFTSLYDVINKYLMIPLAIVLIIIGLKYAFGDIDRRTSKQFLKNIGIIFFMVAVMPSVFSFINNNVIGKDFLKSVAPQSSSGQTDVHFSNNSDGSATAESTTLINQNSANYILRTNTTDLLYIYNNSPKLQSAFGGDDFPAKPTEAEIKATINEMKNVNTKFAESDTAKLVTFDYSFDLNEQIKSQSDDLSGIPVIFKHKVHSYDRTWAAQGSEDDAQASVLSYKQYATEKLSEGVLGIGKEFYHRYCFDWLNIMIQLIAEAIMYFCVGYSVLKLIFELLIHQLFGPVMAAMDLTGGQRIKRYLSAIIGCYMGLLISAIIIILYSYACNYISKSLGITGFTKSLMMIALAIIFLDGPNIIARYFGINTGVRGGMAMAGLAMMKLARTATAPARVASSVGTAAINNKVRDSMNAPRMRQNEARRQAENQEREARRQSENQEREARRQAENRDRQQMEYDSKMDDFKNKYGSDGNYEQFERPIEYDPENGGSESNKNAILRDMATDSVNYDMTGNKANFDKQAETSSEHLNASAIDKENVLNANPAQLRDAQKGVYSGIANKAELSGGTRDAYVEAAKTTLGDKATGKNGTVNTELVNYTADAAYNAKHATQIRTEARNIQNSSTERISDVEAYTRAMDKTTNGRFKYTSEANKEKIAKIEIERNGSLRDGSVYDNRPKMRDGSRPKSAIG